MSQTFMKCKDRIKSGNYKVMAHKDVYQPHISSTMKKIIARKFKLYRENINIDVNIDNKLI